MKRNATQRNTARCNAAEEERNAMQCIVLLLHRLLQSALPNGFIGTGTKISGPRWGQLSVPISGGGRSLAGQLLTMLTRSAQAISAKIRSPRHPDDVFKPIEATVNLENKDAR